MAETGAPVRLILGQSKAPDRHQALTLSVRWGERALPVAWRAVEADGAIGFAVDRACSTRWADGCLPRRGRSCTATASTERQT